MSYRDADPWSRCGRALLNGWCDLKECAAGNPHRLDRDLVGNWAGGLLFVRNLTLRVILKAVKISVRILNWLDWAASPCLSGILCQNDIDPSVFRRNPQKSAALGWRLME